MEASKPDVALEVECVERCQRGEREAFGFLAEKYQKRILSLVFHLVGPRHEGEDLAQEIFIKAFVAIRSYNFQASFGTWLSRIAVNHCYDYLRRRRVSRVSYFSSMTEQRQRELQAQLERPEAAGMTGDAGR